MELIFLLFINSKVMKYSTIVLLGFIFIFSSCRQDQMAYRNTYKFQVKDYHQAEVGEAIQKPQVVSVEALSASNEIKAPVVKPLGLAKVEKSHVSVTKEKEVDRKELRQKIRNLKSEMKQNPEMAKTLKAEFQKAQSAKKSVSVNSKIYVGAIIGIGGLVLMILAGGAVYTIGSLALLVGVILVVWGLLEQV
jgi:F0F1-type ATP synthase assembly protein I